MPFGCAALVLLNKKEREKFKVTCALMIFVHYALDHPLYTYALYSPMTKKIIFRQDVIFLPYVFPMREARIRGGLVPDGDVVVAYRSPVREGGVRDKDTSFEDWKESDSIPPYQDHVTDYSMTSPSDETASSSEEMPPEWPRQQPFHPLFGPRSAVKVPVPWGEQCEDDQESLGRETIGISVQEIHHGELGGPGEGEIGRNDTSQARPKRTTKFVPPAAKGISGDQWVKDGTMSQWLHCQHSLYLQQRRNQRKNKESEGSDSEVRGGQGRGGKQARSLGHASRKRDGSMGSR